MLVPLALNAATGPFLVAFETSGDGRLVGVLLTAFCLLAAIVAWTSRREGAPLLRAALWLAPATFGAVAGVMALGSGSFGLGGYYAALALVSAAGVGLGRGAATPGSA